jgi:hypothetical protein
MPEVAYPFIDVKIDTSGLQPTAERSPGVIAVVGKALPAANAGTATVNTPVAVETLDQAADLFAKKDTDGTVQPTTIYNSLALAMRQDPKPSKIYGVQVNATNYAAALASLEALDDVTMVALANETDVGAASTSSTAPTGLFALKEHVENMTAQGLKRIGVAMVDPAVAKGPSYVNQIATAVGGLKSDSSRMVMVAARGAVQDTATAAMGAIAGYEPHISMVLKKIRGITMPKASQYSPAEIKGLSNDANNIIPIIDPSLIVGESLHFAEARAFTTDASQLYIDIVRTLDDIDFRLKAGLIGAMGDARITKMGMTRVKVRTEGILGPLKARAVIDDFDVQIPVLDILNLPESARTSSDDNVVGTARANRIVDMIVTITYGPAVHRLRVALAPKF